MSEAKYRVAYFSPVGFFKGGAERSLFDLLVNPAVRPLVLVPEDGPIAQKARVLGCDVRIIPFGRIEHIRRPFKVRSELVHSRQFYAVAQSLKQICLEENVGVVHSNGLKAHCINCLARNIGGAKALVHLRDVPFTRSEKLIWRSFHRFSDAVVLVSKACWPGRVPEGISIIPNAMDSYVRLDGTNTSNFQDRIKLGFCGRIHPHKGLHLLLRWMAAAITAGHDCVLSVRGSFAEEANGYQAHIDALISELGLTSRVEFCGFIHDPDELYAGIDLVVVPSEVPDPLPRAIMEAMARGVPVVGYPAGGIPELVRHRETGFLASDAQGFVSALAALMNEPGLRADLVSQAARMIAADFTVVRLHSALNHLYARIAPR